MNLAPTTDQLDLRESIRDVLSAQCPPSFVRQAMSDDQAWRGLWSTAVELGWTSLATRLVDDSGLGTFDLVLTLEACGEALAPLPMVSSVGLAAGALQAGGEAMANELQLIADGQVATLIAQPAAHRLPAAPMALRDGRVHVSVGEITDATRADTFVVLCATTDPARSYVATVPIGPGVTVTPTPSVDPSRPMARLEIDAEPRAVESVDTSEALAPAMAALAAELVGVAAAAA
ncbi:hypothetical protein A5662_03720 [Mycobacteriaceae bacterium 1482268.1]|nr:hypothetical protein A5662_03720 [Mycobacteriaceae bacterium 1482268.1]